MELKVIQRLGSILTRDNIFYDPNLHNIARSDRVGFKTKNPNVTNMRSSIEKSY